MRTACTSLVSGRARRDGRSDRSCRICGVGSPLSDQVPPHHDFDLQRVNASTEIDSIDRRVLFASDDLFDVRVPWKRIHRDPVAQRHDVPKCERTVLPIAFSPAPALAQKKPAPASTIRALHPGAQMYSSRRSYTRGGRSSRSGFDLLPPNNFSTETVAALDGAPW
jgi:hypothetical protein